MLWHCFIIQTMIIWTGRFWGHPICVQMMNAKQTDVSCGERWRQRCSCLLSVFGPRRRFWCFWRVFFLLNVCRRRLLQSVRLIGHRRYVHRWSQRLVVYVHVWTPSRQLLIPQCRTAAGRHGRPTVHCVDAVAGGSIGGRVGVGLLRRVRLTGRCSTSHDAFLSRTGAAAGRRQVVDAVTVPRSQYHVAAGCHRLHGHSLRVRGRDAGRSRIILASSHSTAPSALGS